MRAVVVALLLLLPVAARQASAHPGINESDTRCSSCHVDKTRGRSVHSALAISCMVCHMISGAGQTTKVGLTTSKEKICFGCHEQATETQQHSPKVKGLCVDCHDSHSSPRRMLLRARAGQSRPSTTSSHQ